jgi:acetoin utilization deacetylase AcuC-like enzyme
MPALPNVIGNGSNTPCASDFLWNDQKDQSMSDLALYYPSGHEAHYMDGHPERPERVEAIRAALHKAGWWDGMQQVSPFKLSDQVLTAIHTPAYLQKLQAFSQRGARLDIDTYTTPASWEIALNTAGGACAVADLVWRGQVRRGFALTRPPGHHATSKKGMGFCLLNNVALAGEYLLREDSAHRLAIVDLDLHHGNGTQEIFYSRGDVMYLSTHQSPLYPGTGGLEEIGTGDGEGANANFPLPPYSGNEAFRSVMQTLILPLLDRFSPEMLLVSVGFDTHWLDPLGLLQLSAGVYGWIIGELADWADRRCAGRIALFLEGGYDLDAGAACALTSTAALLDLPWEDPLGRSPRGETQAWQDVVRQARGIWAL